MFQKGCGRSDVGGAYLFVRNVSKMQGRFELVMSLFECRIVLSFYDDTYIYIFFFLWRCDPTRVMASSFLRFIDHTQRRTTVGRTPLDE